MGTSLVIGGKGFLGSHLVNELQCLGEKVRILARPTTKYPSYENDYTYWGDLRDTKAVDLAMRGIQTVFHVASTDRHAKVDKSEAYDITVEGTLNVLKAAHKHGARRVIYASMSGAYGSVKSVPADEDTPFDRTDLQQQIKLISEQRAWEFAKASGLQVTIVRPTAVMGPGDKSLLKMFKGIKRGRFMMVGKGDKYFHIGHVNDVVQGMILCRERDSAVGETFILGGEDYISLKEMAQVIADEFHVKLPAINLPSFPVVFAAALCEYICQPFNIEPPLHRRVNFFQHNRAYSVQKAKALLGFSPRYTAHQVLRDTARWYQDNGWL